MSQASGTTDVSAYTEATFPGYAPITLNAWGTPFLNASNQGESDETLRTFTFTGGSGSQQIYGAYITDTFGNAVGASINPVGPVTLSPSNPNYTVQPTYVDGNVGP